MSIPSPSISEFTLGPLTIHIYALCLMAGMIVAWWLGRKRWIARGGLGETFESIAIVAIPSGIIGARIYHVATHWEDYFGEGRDPISALYIWEGGIAIFGAVIGGALGAAYVAWRRGARLSVFADSLAPGLIFAQAVGRLGNWFNQELFGGPDDGPLGVEIDPEHRPPEYRDVETFQPTFLYELTWNVAGGFLLLWLDRKFKFGWGKLIALYMVVYGTGRFFIEGIRTDFSYMVGPFRTNQVTALVFIIVGLVLFAVLQSLFKGREPWVERAGVGGPDYVADEDDSGTAESEDEDDSGTAESEDEDDSGTAESVDEDDNGTAQDVDDNNTAESADATGSDSADGRSAEPKAP
ncbi:prolipoprotein diacylglyceryl transferase [Ornithinimicrobium sp. F0845]|uniref:prolipoprotein diacylglyceryl transferase n=1 Tax=Ornithinimicrobium sp. F0845 TaxID=2926412 RepID=UPI001FF16FB2|nr:prolipoprotein diacylglyceryl transferase [Ornithinimicrobium sp. F0845]MCK0113143.1 prolipoprotein diacylglyceryl transferase [Ornithinimicrobium sp. F0845]